ncbi:MAG: PEGA domain-containing protein [Planctomycetaceae bacterium]|nr:PEGA domain-containing protein [Planctomycetaceae bacterium]
MPVRRLHPVAVIALLLAIAGTESGCVHRRMTIRTDPPGALVEVDGERLGPTPVSTDFLYYGTREITLSAPGYETLVVKQPVAPPWYQVFPIEFFADNLLPFRVTNRHDFVYRMQPRDPQLDVEDRLMDRARSFRSHSQVGG